MCFVAILLLEDILVGNLFVVQFHSREQIIKQQEGIEINGNRMPYDAAARGLLYTFPI